MYVFAQGIHGGQPEEVTNYAIKGNKGQGNTGREVSWMDPRRDEVTKRTMGLRWMIGLKLPFTQVAQ